MLGLFFFVPVLLAFALSLTDFDLYALADLRQYCASSASPIMPSWCGTPLFWKALGNTFYFVIVGVPLSIGLSLGAAMLLNGGVTAPHRPVPHRLVRAGRHHPRRGRGDLALSAPHPLRHDQLRPRTASASSRSTGSAIRDWSMPAIILFAVWKNFGYNMVILLAGLQTIPNDLYEAARIDGANGWQRFRHVTLPALAPMLLLVSILTMAGYFQLFAEPYVMTQGGPVESTVSVLYFMYEQGFKWWNLGFASAVAFILFLIMIVFTMLQYRFARARGAIMMRPSRAAPGRAPDRLLVPARRPSRSSPCCGWSRCRS